MNNSDYYKKKNDKRMSIQEAISTFVHDGCSLTTSGFAAREPQAALAEIIRQGKKNLHLIDDSKGMLFDTLIGAGCVSRLTICYVVGTIFSLSAAFRNAVERDIPGPVEVKEVSNYSLSLMFLAGAMNVPYLPTKSLLASDLAKVNPDIKIAEDPYTGQPIALVPAVHPDVAIIHVQRADIQGNAQIWGSLVNDDNKARAAKHTIITCEEIVPTEEIQRIPNMTAIPYYCVDAVVEVPYGSHPWSCCYYYWDDLPFALAYDRQSKTRDGLLKWIDEWIYNCTNWEAYCEKVGRDRLRRLTHMEHMLNRLPA